MAFIGFDKKDGEPLYDTLESAIERARMLKAWDSDPNSKILAYRNKKIPLWFAHLVQGTWFEGLAYKEIK